MNGAVVRILVAIDLAEGTVPVGVAHIALGRAEVTTTFAYHAEYLARPLAFAVSADLPLTGGPHTVAGLPGALTDGSPDRWGRRLIARRLRDGLRDDPQHDPRRGPVGARELTEVDFLLGVSDTTRHGALRYALAPGGPFLAADHEVPALLDLPRLLDAADGVGDETAATRETAAVRMLLDAGSASLGGARPKVPVRDGGRLLIAKLPQRGDDWNVMAWEITALDLAARAGIRVPARRLLDVRGRRALLLDRFDRTADDRRIPYLSAMSLVGGRDDGAYDYLEVAEAMTAQSDAVGADLRELWRRIAFSLLVNNTDDHLRNHGFLRTTPAGWRLSPVFDVNPDPDVRRPRATSIGFATDRAGGLRALLDAAGTFGLTASGAVQALTEVAAAVARWRDTATSHGVDVEELEFFVPCFEGWRPQVDALTR